MWNRNQWLEEVKKINLSMTRLMKKKKFKISDRNFVKHDIHLPRNLSILFSTISKHLPFNPISTKIFSSTGFKSRVRIPRWTNTKPRWRNKEIPRKKVDAHQGKRQIYTNLQSVSIWINSKSKWLGNSFKILLRKFEKRKENDIFWIKTGFVDR